MHGGKGRERNGLERRGQVRGREGAEGWGRRVGKADGGLDLDICPGAPSSLVTQLLLSRQ